MSDEKRSVATDALATLGSIIDDKAKRDAIHLAVEPAVAGCKLGPGDDVGRLPNGTYGCIGHGGNFLGIVDPFLKSKVMPGERFWLILYPRQISSLRHVWSHPEFVDEAEIKAVMMPNAKEIAAQHKSHIQKIEAAIGVARNRLEGFASNLNVYYAELIEHATAYVQHGEYWSEGEKFEGVDMPSTFWKDFETVTGIEVPDKGYKEWYGYFFSCSC